MKQTWNEMYVVEIYWKQRSMEWKRSGKEVRERCVEGGIRCKRWKRSGKEVEQGPGNEKEGWNIVKTQTMEWKRSGKEVGKR